MNLKPAEFLLPAGSLDTMGAAYDQSLAWRMGNANRSIR